MPFMFSLQALFEDIKGAPEGASGQYTAVSQMSSQQRGAIAAAGSGLHPGTANQVVPEYTRLWT